MYTLLFFISVIESVACFEKINPLEVSLTKTLSKFRKQKIGSEWVELLFYSLIWLLNVHWKVSSLSIKYDWNFQRDRSFWEKRFSSLQFVKGIHKKYLIE